MEEEKEVEVKEIQEDQVLLVEEVWFILLILTIEIYLIKDIVSRNPRIKPKNIVGHSDIAPDRKIDPGPLFPWKELYQNGIGTWYKDDDLDYFLDQFSKDMPSTKLVQTELFEYGYDIKLTGIADRQTSEVVRAFQLRFRPEKYDGVIDVETAAVIFALNRKY